jgi:hypothetical protein
MLVVVAMLVIIVMAAPAGICGVRPWDADNFCYIQYI